jgi:hypothetical protein
VISRAAAVALLIGTLAGCAAAHPASAPRPALRLEATLLSPLDISLEWHGTEPDAVGQIVEFATEPNGPYAILQFLPPGQTTYRHPDLLPSTPFYYRVRAVHGPATPWVDVTLPDGTLPGNAPPDDWVEPRVRPGGPVATASVRTAGAPTDLTATIKHANGIAFTWTDNATDEEGYLLEVKPRGSADFRVAATLDPNVNSAGLITLPDEKQASYRIRAFYYGQPSNLAHQTTGGA